MSKYKFPIYIRRFNPIEVIDFNPDKPIGYMEPYKKTLIEDADDVVALGEELLNAELEAWKGRHASEIIETVIDGAADTLIAVAKYLEHDRSPEAKQHHFNLMKLIVRMKFPIIACISECLGAIYLKGGLPAVRKAIEKLIKGEKK